MKQLLFIAVLFIGRACLAQSVLSVDSADFYLDRIDNNAVGYSYNYTGGTGMNADAKFLYQHTNKHIIDKLIDFLDDTTKVLACHFLLTRLLEPGYKGFYHTTEDITDAILVLYQYNGLSWKRVYDKINLTAELQVDSAASKKIKRYWLAKKESPLYKVLSKE